MEQEYNFLIRIILIILIKLNSSLEFTNSDSKYPVISSNSLVRFCKIKATNLTSQDIGASTCPDGIFFNSQYSRNRTDLIEWQATDWDCICTRGT